MRLVCLLLFAALTLASGMPPIIFEPGLLGSRLELIVKQKQAGMPSSCSNLKNGWHLSWISTNFFTLHMKCFIQTAKTTCNADQKDSMGWPRCAQQFGANVGFRGNDFAGLEGVRHLDNLKDNTNVHIYYFKAFEELLKAHGWDGAGEDIFAATYDWRFMPTGLVNPNNDYEGDWKGSDLERHKKLIEMAHAKTGKKVLILAHSMGTMMTHLLTHQYGDAWCEEHIGAIIHFAPALAGSYLGTAMPLGGKHIPHIPDDWVMALGSTWPVFPFLSVSQALGGNNTVYVDEKGRSYTLADIDQLLGRVMDTSYGKTFAAIRQRTDALIANGKPVGIRTHVFGGSGLRSANQFAITNFTDNVPNSDVTGYTDGDGTVPLAPLQALMKRWGAGSGKLTFEVVSSVSHLSFITDKEFLEAKAWPKIKELIKSEWNITTKSVSPAVMQGWREEDTEAVHPWTAETAQLDRNKLW